MSKNQSKEVKTVSSSSKFYWLGLAVLVLIVFGVISFVTINKPKTTSEQNTTESSSVEDNVSEQTTDTATKDSSSSSEVNTVSDTAGSVSAPVPQHQNLVPIDINQVKPAVAVPSAKTAPVLGGASSNNPVMLAKNLRAVNANSLTGPKKISVPPEAVAASKAKRENMLTQEQLSQIPSEIANEKPESIGQAVLPDGTVLYIVFDDSKKPSKVVEVQQNGKKTLKTISSEGKVDSIESDGKKLNLEYNQLQNSQTQITFKDQQNNICEKRLFNSQGLLIQQFDATGTVTNYTYGFDNGNPINYTKADTATGKVTKGSFSEIENLQFSKYLFSTEPNIKTTSYEHDNDGKIKKIIENKGLDSEIIRELNDKQQVTSFTRTKDKVTYLYEYDKKGNISAITIVSADGSKKVIKSTDPEFSEMISETETFNPIEFGETIKMHESVIKYRNENMLNQQIMNQIRAKNLPSAREIQGINPNIPGGTRGYSAPQRPASVPKAPSAPAGIRR